MDVNERDQFITAGGINSSLLINHFSYDIASYKTHIKSLNKTFVNVRTAERRMYYNPIQSNHLLGVLYYFNQAISTFHTLVIADLVGKLGSEYQVPLRIIKAPE